MNVDRSALTALVLFGLLGLGFAVVALGLNREPKSTPAKKEEQFKGPELLPLPREVSTASRSVFITASAPGMSAEEIEKTVADQLQRVLLGLNGVASIYTRIRPGECRSELSLSPGVNEHLVRAAISERLAANRHLFPEGTLTHLNARDPDALPVSWIAVSDRSRSNLEVSDAVRNILLPSLLKIPGIADVELRGATNREIGVSISPQKMLALGLSMADVASVAAPMDLKTDQNLAKQLEQVKIGMRDGATIYLRDVATVSEEVVASGVAMFDGRRAVLSGIHLTDDANPMEVAARLNDRGLIDNMPEGMKVEMAADVFGQGAEHLLVEYQLPLGLPPAIFDERISRSSRLASQIGRIIALSPRTGQHASAWQLWIPLAAGHKLRSEEVQAEIRAIANQLPGIRPRICEVDSNSLPPRALGLLQVRIVGNDRETLNKWAREMVREGNVAKSQWNDIAADATELSSELKMQVDRDRAAALGVSARDIVETYTSATGKLRTSINGVGIKLTLALQVSNIETIGNLPIQTASGKSIIFKDVVRLEQISRPKLLERLDGHPCVTIVANPGTAVLDQARLKLRQLAEASGEALMLPQGYRIDGP